MPYTIGLFRVQDPPLKVRYVSIALPLLTLQECNQGIYITYWMAASTPPAKTTVNVPVPNHPQLGMESWRVCIYDRQLLSMHAAHVLAIYIYIYIHMYRGKERERESEWMSSMVRQIEAATQSLCQSGSTFAASCPSRSTVRRLHPGTSNSLRSSWEVFRERSDPSRLLPGHPRIPQLHLEANWLYKSGSKWTI